MRILALDSATLTLSAALVDVADDGSAHVLGERAETGRGRHSVLLPGVLLDLLRDAGLNLAEVDGLAAGLGPGSFTGLRTGLATLKSLSYASQRPLAGASSLQAMALDAASRLPAGSDALLVPVLDARRGEVYAGFYGVGPDGGVVERSDEEAIGPDDLLARLKAHEGPFVLFGEGTGSAAALAEAASRVEGLPGTPPARAVARLVAGGLGPYRKASVLALVPHYVRRSEAELKREAGTLNIPGLTAPPAGPDPKDGSEG